MAFLKMLRKKGGKPNIIKFVYRTLRERFMRRKKIKI